MEAALAAHSKNESPKHRDTGKNRVGDEEGLSGLLVFNLLLLGQL